MTNKSSFDDVPAGPELDAAIAAALPEISPESSVSRDFHGKRFPCHTPSPFSTDIAAAWRVVEAMRARGWEFSVWSDGDVIRAAFNIDQLIHQSTGATAPEAICRAALAVEKKGGE